MFQYVLCYNSDTLRSHHNLFTVDVPDHLICDFFFHIHRFNIIHPEWKNIFIVNSIHNRITVELISKGLTCSKEFWIFCSAGINRENRCSCKSKQMIFLEILHNRSVHIPKLTAVALIKNNNDMFRIHFMSRILFYKGSQFLDCSNNDVCVRVFQLPF